MIGFNYMQTIKRLILSLKFDHRSHIAGFLAQRLSLIVYSHPTLSQALENKKLIITYVPSHRIRKYRIKGYNQSELLGRSLADALGIPMKDLARRVRYTRSQTRLSRQKRLKNLIGAFVIDRNFTLDGDETILIVDDITTTGSTLVHVAHQIKEKHPTVKVWGAVVGRHGN